MPAGEPDPIAALLAGSYPDPDRRGEWLRAESRSVVIEDSLDGSEAELVAALGISGRVAVISDANTHAALGRRVERALAGRFTVAPVMLGDSPRADADTLSRLVAAVEPRTDAVIAVGSGTINDLGKLVAFERGCPQLVFATAPSMNGFTSLSASMTTDGLKRSVRTRTPLGAFFDLGVLAAAPKRLIRAGLGDSTCRATAQADWLLSHLLLDRAYREAPFELLAADERALFAQADGLVGGDLVAMRHLVRTLVLSGFGMTICNGSFPASQGEHLLSHYVDMMRPDVAPSLHGEQIGVCTVVMSRLQARVLACDTPPLLQPTAVDRADVIGHFGPVIGEGCWRELALKRFDRAATDELNARLAVRWDAIRAQIAGVAIAPDALARILATAGAPVEVTQLGWPASLFDAALRHAREIRNRYTFLDLAADSRPR
jgi:glycerol-1-phosphate dehydrogenase [NAD(P)+]